MSERPVIRLQGSGWWWRTRHTVFGCLPYAIRSSLTKFPDSQFIYVGPFATAAEAYAVCRCGGVGV